VYKSEASSAGRPVVSAPHLESVPPISCLAPGCCIHPTLCSKNDSPLCDFWPPLLRDPDDGPGTNGRLALRRSAFAVGGQVSTEWSRCPGSMARRARESVASLRRSSAGWMPTRIGRLSAGVGRRRPVTFRKASLMAGSIRRV